MSKIEKALKKAKLKKWNSERNEQHSLVHKEMPLRNEKELAHVKAKMVKLEMEHLEKHRLVTFLDNSEAVDFYNLLGTKLLESSIFQLPVTILITSAVDGEGKTVTAINLSASIAKRTRKNVILIDADLRKPRIQDYLGCHSEKGLSDYLFGKEDLEDLIINPGETNVFVIPAGKTFYGDADIFSSSKMSDLFEEIKHRYPDSYVICDTPPLLLGSDTVLISSYADGVILVVQSGKTTKDQIREAIDMLENRNIYGLVMNKADMSNRKYYYYRK